MNSIFSRSLSLGAIVGASLSIAAQVAAAQPAQTQAGASAAPDSTAGSALEKSLDDIVVTAQKKGVAERAQDVPIALSAFSKDALAATHVADLTDIAKLAPNVRLQSTGSIKGFGTFYIRGAGVTGSIPSNDPAVGTFINGMPLGISTGALTELYDLASVEVLRGPQGTLFGRNVTGGAILLTTARPTDSLHADLRVGGGTSDQWVVSGAVGSTTDNGVFGAKMDFLQRHLGGYFHDVGTGRRVGESDVSLIRPTIVLKPTPSLNIAVMGEIGRESGDGAISSNFFVPGSLISKTYTPPPGKFDVELNTPGNSDLTWKHVVANADWKIGPGTITSITGLREVKHDHITDYDGSPVDYLTFGTHVKQHQFFQELRFAGKPFGTDAINITAGGNYMNQYYLYGEQRFNFKSALQGSIDHQQYGAFAQTEITLPLDLTLIGGLRYTYEKKAAVISKLGSCSLDLSTCNVDFRGSKSWHNLSPKFGLNWKPDKDLLVYGSFTRGFRSGGYNVRTSGAGSSPGPYDQETVDAYEVGLKSELFDRRIRLNLAGFLNKAKGLQEIVIVDGLNQTIVNAATATIKGAEADVTVVVAKGLLLTGTAGYLHPKYDRFDYLPNGVNLTPPQSPKWTTSASINYETALGSLGKISLRGAYSYVASRYADVANLAPLKSYSVLDASATLDLNDHVSVSIYGKNLANKAYVIFAQVNAAYGNNFLAPPRTVMGEVTFKY